MDDTSGRSLDPFEFHGHPASNIPGLGGSAPVPDPTYAFHTVYVPVARGHAHFLIRFTNLHARRGSLLLRVHMLADEPGATAQLVTSHRVQLNWLGHHGGEMRLRFEAFRGARYALMGLVPDQLDASAEALSITLDRPAPDDGIANAGDVTDARSTAYSSETIRSATPLLLSLDAPSFAQPVSQPCTLEQYQETAFRTRCDGLPGLPANPVERWQVAYALQVLDRYGVLRAGARGLTLGRIHPAIAQGIADAGASAFKAGLNTIGQGHTGQGYDASLDPTALPGDLFAFDFLASIHATDTLNDGRMALTFIEKAMECLRPGGLAVHVIGYHHAPVSSPFTVFDRNGLERIAFSLISRGHQVARLKPALTQHLPNNSSGPAISFGIIARRAALLR